MHISSLPGNQGIGTMGRAAREFADFLVSAGQRYWQLLPICPTSFGDSPYQSFSTFAGNPYFIDLDMLAEAGLLEKSEYENVDWESTPDRVNYGALYRKRYPILRLAAERFLRAPGEDYARFCRENAFWLEDYALFMALKEAHCGAPWYDWEAPLRSRESAALSSARQSRTAEIDFWKVLQYLFFSQWKALREYVNERGIRFIGDLPIYVSLDSVDVWASPELFQLDENKLPKEVAGCPPDGFSADGQLWGNPLFDWETMAKDDYAWWTGRISYLCRVYNVLRIDHFRGFDSYYAIPYGDKTAHNGVWRTGPGIELFRAVERAIGRQSIIAEDLGFLTPSVRRLLSDSGFPGMKVLQFAFDSRDGGGSEYLPGNYPENCVAYVGTHDNDTAIGWYSSVFPGDAAMARDQLGLTEAEGIHWGMMRGIWESAAMLTVVQAQDILGLGSEGRMNIPSTVGGNWSWRALPGSFTKELAEKIRAQMLRWGRCAE